MRAGELVLTTESARSRPGQPITAKNLNACRDVRLSQLRRNASYGSSTVYSLFQHRLDTDVSLSTRDDARKNNFDERKYQSRGVGRSTLITR
eukprot:3974315-Pleurochrysis_carterae.AAC.1